MEMKIISNCSCVNNLRVIFFLQFIYKSSHGSQLSATYSLAKLPTPDYAHRPWYDGLDSVYIFGGYLFFGHSNRILRYSLSSDTIHFLGSLSVDAVIGSVRNIFYFGADSNNNKVLKYSPSANSSTVVAQLPRNIAAIPTIKLDNNTVLILGSGLTGREILSFDLATRSTTTLETQLPFSVRFGGAIKFGRNKAYLFPELSGSMWSWIWCP